MKLIADSGSTKTQWILIIDQIEIRRFSTIGLNPFFVESFQVTSIIKDSLSEKEIQDINEVFFYGAGCRMADKQEIIKEGILSILPKAKVNVDSDIIGAAKALFGDNSGVACILGTGSNAVVYDGIEIIERIISLGYILGDEGSGAYIGRNLLTDFLRDKMPSDLKQEFYQEFKYDKDSLIHQVYKSQFPNRFLAEFTRFAGKYKHEHYIKELINSAFEGFIEKQLMTLSNWETYRLGFVGSVSYHFKENMIEVLEKYSISKPIFIENPIDSLFIYHASKQ